MTELWPHPDDPIVPEVEAVCRRLELGRRSRELDRAPAFPKEEFRSLGGAGLLGLTVPAELGGRGLPLARAAVALWHLAYHGGTAFAKLAMQPEFSTVLAEHGSPELLERWYRPLVEGRVLVGNHITEPSAGSDILGLELTATREGGAYVLSGTKSEAAFASDADAALVYARAPGTRGAEGVSVFLVSQTLPGVRRTVGALDLGERWQRRGTVVYEQVRVPEGCRLGEEGAAFGYLRRELARDRGLLAAIYLGVARASWDETVRHVQQRVVAGRPLCERQAVAFPLIDDGVQLEATWLFTQRALARLDRGEEASADTAMAKVRATEVALATLDRCLQLHGGAGYSATWPHEQRWRDVRSGPIAHGPSDVLREVAARRLWPRARAATPAPGADPARDARSPRPGAVPDASVAVGRRAAEHGPSRED